MSALPAKPIVSNAANCVLCDAPRETVEFFVVDCASDRRICSDCIDQCAEQLDDARLRKRMVALLASAIEARSDATGTGAAEGESAAPIGETPND